MHFVISHVTNHCFKIIKKIVTVHHEYVLIKWYITKYIIWSISYNFSLECNINPCCENVKESPTLLSILNFIGTKKHKCQCQYLNSIESSLRKIIQKINLLILALSYLFSLIGLCQQLVCKHFFSFAFINIKRRYYCFVMYMYEFNNNIFLFM